MERAEQRGVKVESVLKLLAILILIGIIGLAYFYFFMLPKRGGGLVQAVPTKVGAIQVLLVIDGPGVPPLPYFNRVNDVAVGPDGNIYITDGLNDRVCVFNRYGRFLFTFGEQGRAIAPPGSELTWRPGKFWLPYGIDVDDAGNIYVADTRNDRIQVFDATGRFLRWFPEGGGIHPSGLSVVDDKLYVADPGGNKVGVFDLNGKHLKTMGKPGRKAGEMDGPADVVVAPDGTVYVSDSLNMTVTAFTPDGKVKWVYGAPPKGLGGEARQIGLASGLSLDKEGRIYLIDQFHFNIHVLDKDGNQIAQVGHRGVNPGEFNFSRGLEIDEDGNLYVADWGNDRVQKIKILEFVKEEG